MRSCPHNVESASRAARIDLLRVATAESLGLGVRSGQPRPETCRAFEAHSVPRMSNGTPALWTARGCQPFQNVVAFCAM